MSKDIEEKAKELIEKLLLFQPLIPDYDREGQAKEFALICVDEIIQALKYHTWQNNKLIEYWKQVKQEINKQ
jgi:hypothetical protein